MILKHPILFVIMCIMLLLTAYMLFNLALPKCIDNHEEQVYKIKGNDYVYNIEWKTVEKDKLVGRVVQDNYDAMTRFGLLFFPNKLYSVKGDKEKISYYIKPGLSEFHWGYHIYSKDIDLPDINTIDPYRIELGHYELDLPNEVHYFVEDKATIDKVMSIIRSDDNSEEIYSSEVKDRMLESRNSVSSSICLFDERVPGSVYIVRGILKDDDWRVYYTDKSIINEEELRDITSAILLIIENGEKVIQD